MAIVPNKNGVPISPVTPLVDPHSYTKFEMAFMSDGLKTSAQFELAVGLNAVLAANPLRNTVTIINPPDNTDVSADMRSIAALDEGVPVYAGNGFTWKGKSATNAFYVYSDAVQTITVWVG